MRRKHRYITGPDQLEDRKLLSHAAGAATFPLPLNTHPAVVATATPAPGLLTGGNALVATQTNSLAAAAVDSLLQEATGTIVSTTYKGEPRVYYENDHGQIVELALWGGNWHRLVVTTVAGGPPAATGTALTSTTYKGEPRVYYESGDGQIVELAFYGGSWHNLVVTTAAGGPPATTGIRKHSTDPDSHAATTGTALTSTTYNGDPRVYYESSDGQIHELALWGDNKWHHLVVTTAAGGPRAHGATALTSTTYNGDPRVYYESSDGQIHELALWGDNKWHHLVLTTGGPEQQPAELSDLTSTTYNGNPSVYYVDGSAAQIHQLAFYGGSWHNLEVTRLL